MAVQYKAGRKAKEPVAPGAVQIRGFVRGCLVDPDGTEHMGDWHENALSTTGIWNTVLAVVGNTSATIGTWLAVGTMSGAAVNSVTSGLNTEYAPATDGTSGRKTAATAATTSAPGTLSYTAAFASSEVTSTATINAIAIMNSSRTGAGTSYSIATFASSTKGSNQALNVTYQWNFAT